VVAYVKGKTKLRSIISFSDACHT